jgi:hypothetical protein
MVPTVPPTRVSRLMHAARYRPPRRTTAVILWHSLLECLLVLGDPDSQSATAHHRCSCRGASLRADFQSGRQGVRRPRQPRYYTRHVGVRSLSRCGRDSVHRGSVGRIASRRAHRPRCVGQRDRRPSREQRLPAAPGWTNWALFLAEAASMAAIVLLVAWFLAVPRLAPLVPGLVGFLVGLAIACSDRSQEVHSILPASSVRQFSQAIMNSYGSTCLLRWVELRWRPCCSIS